MGGPQDENQNAIAMNGRGGTLHSDPQWIFWVEKVSVGGPEPVIQSDQSP